jgi:hypothetical protein
MKSPFPGMDPYLEAHWGDIHTSLIVYARNHLNEQLPDDLQARVEESLAVQEDELHARTIYPEVRVSEKPGPGSATSRNVATAVLEGSECYRIPVLDETRTERRLEIIDTTDGGRVVTVIEFLSPANKDGVDAQLLYLRKQREVIEAGINLVEIDLVRSGHYVLAAPYERLPASCHTPYLACVRQATEPNVAEVYPMPLQRPLPKIRIPLRPSDQDAFLELQPLIDACYRDGRYHRMNYRADSTPRLGEADAAWTDELLRGAGVR